MSKKTKKLSDKALVKQNSKKLGFWLILLAIFLFISVVLGAIVGWFLLPLLPFLAFLYGIHPVFVIVVTIGGLAFEVAVAIILLCLGIFFRRNNSSYNKISKYKTLGSVITIVVVIGAIWSFCQDVMATVSLFPSGDSFTWDPSILPIILISVISILCTIGEFICSIRCLVLSRKMAPVILKKVSMTKATVSSIMQPNLKKYSKQLGLGLIFVAICVAGLSIFLFANLPLDKTTALLVKNTSYGASPWPTLVTVITLLSFLLALILLICGIRFLCGTVKADKLQVSSVRILVLNTLAGLGIAILTTILSIISIVNKMTPEVKLGTFITEIALLAVVAITVVLCVSCICMCKKNWALLGKGAA